MEYCNAAHTELYIVRNGMEIIELTTTSSVVGRESNSEYVSESFKIQNGDRIVLYTDGIPEARSSGLEFYGIDRFKKILLEHREDTAENTADILFSDLNEFQGNAPVKDDITLLMADVLNVGSESVLDDKPAGQNIQDNEPAYFKEKYTEAVTLYNSGNYLNVIPILKNLENVCTAKSDKSTICNVLAFSYYKTDQYQEAINKWQELLQIEPENASAKKYIAAVEQKLAK